MHLSKLDDRFIEKYESQLLSLHLDRRQVKQRRIKRYF